MRGDIDYQYFRDLAENKGKFFVGASDIAIVDNNGKNLGTFLRVTPTTTREIDAPPPKQPADLFACFDANPPADCDVFLNGSSQPTTETITLDPVSIPMIDFSPLTRQSVFATLVDPQYLVSVNHNQGYFNVQFGDSSSEKPDDHHYNYNVVRRNNYLLDPKKVENDRQTNPNGEARERNNSGEKLIRTPDGQPTNHWDYHAPRLSKLVTEVVPANEIEPTSDQDLYEFYENFGDRTKFPLFIRAGSGVQATVQSTSDTKDTRKSMGNAQFLTGGTVLPVSCTADNGLGKILVAAADGTTNDVFRDNGYGPLTTLGLPGDSGSVIFGYDLENKRWVLLGVYSDYFTANPENQPGGSVNKSYWNYHHPHYVRALEAENTAGKITTSGATLTWTPNNNTSTIAGVGTSLTVDLADMSLATIKGHNGNTGDNPWNPQLHHGKTFHITGNGNTIRLTDNINQGAGAIHITGDTTFEGTKDGITWLGAGLDIDKGKTVTWKIGEGTLIINGKGTLTMLHLYGKKTWDNGVFVSLDKTPVLAERKTRFAIKAIQLTLTAKSLPSA